MTMQTDKISKTVHEIVDFLLAIVWAPLAFAFVIFNAILLFELPIFVIGEVVAFCVFVQVADKLRIKNETNVQLAFFCLVFFVTYFIRHY